MGGGGPKGGPGSRWGALRGLGGGKGGGGGGGGGGRAAADCVDDGTGTGARAVAMCAAPPSSSTPLLIHSPSSDSLGSVV